MVALKAQWEVRAGLIPGTSMEEYTKLWNYTSVHFAQDGNRRGDHFEAMKHNAHKYAQDLEKGGLNWVAISYVWL